MGRTYGCQNRFFSQHPLFLDKAGRRMDFSRSAAVRDGAEGTRMTGVEGPASAGLGADEAAQIFVQDGRQQKNKMTTARSKITRGRTRSPYTGRRRELSSLLGVSRVFMTVGILLVSLVAARIISCLREQVSNKGTARGLFSGAASRGLSDGKDSQGAFSPPGVHGPLDAAALQTCFVNPGFVPDAQSVPRHPDPGSRGNLVPTVLPSLPAARPRRHSLLTMPSVGLLILGSLFCAAGLSFFFLSLVTEPALVWTGAAAGVFVAGFLVVISYSIVLVVTHTTKPRQPAVEEVVTFSTRF